MQTDPIADFLTQIRNANLVYKESIQAPASKIREGIAKTLSEEGYIKGYKMKMRDRKKFIELYLKYSSDNRKERVITHVERASKPGRRLYVKKNEVPRVRGGIGICVLSTPQGVISGNQAKKLGVGGEILCYVW